MMTPSSPRPRGFSSMSPSGTKLNGAGTDSGGGKRNFYTPMGGPQGGSNFSTFSTAQPGLVSSGFAPIDPATIQTVALDELYKDHVERESRELDWQESESMSGDHRRIGAM